MKATVVLLPLLSITSILFIWAPDIKQSPQANMAYRITNACLQVAQVSLNSLIVTGSSPLPSIILILFTKKNKGNEEDIK